MFKRGPASSRLAFALGVWCLPALIAWVVSSTSSSESDLVMFRLKTGGGLVCFLL
jgi:hypothetical protein